MIEQLLSSRWIKNKVFFSIVLGLIYTVVAYLTSKIFFPDSVSISMLFLIGILLIPTIMKLISFEERRERKEGLKHFYKNHRTVIEIYFLMFIGAVLGYFVIAALGFEGFDNLFSYQMKFLGEQGITKVDAGFLSQPAVERFTGILMNNLTVAVIFFILSFFYGAGSVFLLVLNASIFSAFMIFILNTFARAAQNMWTTVGAFSLYLVPELFGFLMAAFAGGVISKALLKEKLGSDAFRNVVKDATILIIASFLVIIIAAALEVYVSAPILMRLIS